MKRAYALFVAICLSCMAGIASAADDATQLSEGEVDQRLRVLERYLDGSRKHGTYWQYGWLGVSGAGLVASTALAVGVKGDSTVDIVEATKSAIGVGYLSLAPLEARLGADPVRGLPDATLAEKQAKLQAAEALLKRNAERAKERTSWKMYAGNLALNLIGGGVILGFGDKSDALVSVASGVVAGSLMIWSAPGQPLRDWQQYQRYGTRALGRQSNRSWALARNAKSDGFVFNYQQRF